MEFCEFYNGKGPGESTSELLKRHATKKLLQKQIMINNVYNFYYVITSARLKVKCLYVPENAIQTQIP